MENSLEAVIFLKVIIEYFSIQVCKDGQNAYYRDYEVQFSKCLNECVNKAFLEDQCACFGGWAGAGRNGDQLSSNKEAVTLLGGVM